MIDDDQLHSIAAAYATQIMFERRKYQFENHHETMTHDQMQTGWVYHYEGFKTGYKACMTMITVH